MSTKKYRRYKPEPEMHGPFDMDPAIIEQLDDDLYGAYLLVCKGDKGGTIVTYVGRGILRERLTEHLITKLHASQFYCKPLADDQEGFVEECRLFHVYGECTYLNNKIHPAVPNGARCPNAACGS